MEYAVGIDSGGTSYRLRAVSEDGSVLAEFTGQSANHYRMSHEELVRTVNDNISSLLDSFGGKRADCRALFCGTTGLDSDADAALLHSLYSNECGLSCPVRIISDAELAHYAVTDGKGIVIVAGTGCIAFGSSRSGVRGRAGGWLFTILGDEGGGAWISRRALQLLSRYLDGAVGESLLIRVLREKLGVNGRDDLCRIAGSLCNPPFRVPSLGAVVSECADSGDKNAIAILEEAAQHAFSLVLDLDAALAVSRGWPDFPVGLWGSTILGSAVMRKRFEDLLHERYPEAVIVLPERSALEAAACQALRMWLH